MEINGKELTAEEIIALAFPQIKQPTEETDTYCPQYDSVRICSNPDDPNCYRRQ